MNTVRVSPDFSITVTLNAAEINAVLQGLGYLPINSAASPLLARIEKEAAEKAAADGKATTAKMD